MERQNDEMRLETSSMVKAATDLDIQHQKLETKLETSSMVKTATDLDIQHQKLEMKGQAEMHETSPMVKTATDLDIRHQKLETKEDEMLEMDVYWPGQPFRGQRSARQPLRGRWRFVQLPHGGGGGGGGRGRGRGRGRGGGGGGGGGGRGGGRGGGGRGNRPNFCVLCIEGCRDGRCPCKGDGRLCGEDCRCLVNSRNHICHNRGPI